MLSFVCCSARLRIDQRFQGLSKNADRKGYRVAQQILNFPAKYLEDGILNGSH